MTAERQKLLKVKAQEYEATITKLERANERITYYEFTFSDDQKLEMMPGQFAMLTMPKEPKPVKRAYSIASTPSEAAASVLKLCITAVEGGQVSNWMHNKSEGEKISFKGPYGRFILPEEHPKAIHFISVGTGVVPFRSMILDAFEKGCDTEIYLYHGNRFEDSVLYDDEFLAIAAEHKNFHYLPCISRPKGEWTGFKGYVQNKLKEVITNAEEKSALFYICGVNAMIKDVCDHLKEVGYEDSNIHFEKYD
jgi:phenol hydroxylase P5 protein